MGGSHYRWIRPPGGSSGNLKKERAVFPQADPVRIIERPPSSSLFLFSIGICAGKCRTLFVYFRTGLPGKNFPEPSSGIMVEKVVDPLVVYPTCFLVDEALSMGDRVFPAEVHVEDPGVPGGGSTG